MINFEFGRLLNASADNHLDGTIAHAIERSFLFIVEIAGFDWIKIDDGKNNFGMTPILKSSAQIELDENIFKARHSVLKKY